MSLGKSRSVVHTTSFTLLTENFSPGSHLPATSSLGTPGWDDVWPNHPGGRVPKHLPRRICRPAGRHGGRCSSLWLHLEDFHFCLILHGGHSDTYSSQLQEITWGRLGDKCSWRGYISGLIHFLEHFFTILNYVSNKYFCQRMGKFKIASATFMKPTI